MINIQCKILLNIDDFSGKYIFIAYTCLLRYDNVEYMWTQIV